jgi:hypothetical protein
LLQQVRDQRPQGLRAGEIGEIGQPIDVVIGVLVHPAGGNGDPTFVTHPVESEADPIRTVGVVGAALFVAAVIGPGGFEVNHADEPGRLSAERLVGGVGTDAGRLARIQTGVER